MAGQSPIHEDQANEEKKEVKNEEEKKDGSQPEPQDEEEAKCEKINAVELIGRRPVSIFLKKKLPLFRSSDRQHETGLPVLV